MGELGLGLGGRGAPSKFQRGGSKKNLMRHSGADPEKFGRGVKF